MEEIGESFSEIDWRPHRLYDLGDERYLMLVKPRLRGAGSGVEVETDVGHVVQLARRQDRAVGRLPRLGHRPRSRRSQGIGDVAGEPGGRAAQLRGIRPGGVDRWLEHWSDELVHRPARSGLDDPGPVSGKEAMRAHIQDWMDTFDEFWFGPVELIDAGEKTVVASSGSAGAPSSAGSKRSRHAGSFLRFVMERSRVAASTRPAPKPSKPWGCRSKKLTPTPDPAGYCRGRCRRRTWSWCAGRSSLEQRRLGRHSGHPSSRRRVCDYSCVSRP